MQDAVILAAGNGDRFRTRSRHSKLLYRINGQPLILRTLTTAVAAGITHFTIVVGYEAEAVRSTVQQGAPGGVQIQFSYNPDWHLENGVSVLTARRHVRNRRFALLMGDHLFDPAVLARLRQTVMAADHTVLAVDSRPATPAFAAEATKVRLDGDRITAIGKDLDRYDALDTGVFVCAPSLFEALRESRAAGDTTLSGGMRRLAHRGLLRAHDIGNAAWHDIDTLEDLASAESLLAGLPETA